METIQVVLDAELLKATDSAARRARVNRSELIRKALREHLKRVSMLELETRDRRGYQQFPDNPAEVEDWEKVAAWPEP